jgi:hypothetical protein
MRGSIGASVSADVIVLQCANQEESVIGRQSLTLKSGHPIGHRGGEHRYTGICQWQGCRGAALPDRDFGRGASEYRAAHFLARMDRTVGFGDEIDCRGIGRRPLDRHQRNPTETQKTSFDHARAIAG